MADLVITPSDVLVTPGFETSVRTGNAGEPINAGQSVFLDSADNLIKKSDKTAESTGRIIGVAVNTASVAGQPISYVQENARVTVGSVVSVGETYVISTAGGISPVLDLASTEYLGYVGYGFSATEILVMAVTTGVPKA